MADSIKTTEMIVSYPSLVTARSVAGGDPKYQVTLVSIPGVTDVDALKAAFIAAGKEKFGEKFGELLKKPNFKRCLRTSADDEKAAESYPEGSIFIRCYSPTKPDAVSRYADPATSKPARLSDAETAEQLYAGSHARAVVRFYGFDSGGSKGVTCAINSIQWLGDGGRLDNRVKAEDAFEAEAAPDAADLEVSEEAPAPAKEMKKAKPAAVKAVDLTSLL